MDAAFEVHRAFGPGYLESIYEEAFAVEFSSKYFLGVLAV
ncbi:MAG: hypothetical protein HY527_14355 [Betaproteobacteria bacterium]|nr:hypothetical protein [Betaproteobacteria bacterium]